jgi:exodeoxyribonuclease VII large subunit
MVADCRALTPSEAAERVVPNQTEVLDWLSGLEGKLRLQLGRRLELARNRLKDLAGRPCFRLPLERVRDQERRVDELAQRLQRAVQQRLTLARQRVEAEAGRLESLSPLNVLSRGYSLTRRHIDRAVVRHPEQVRVGEALLTRVQYGTILSRVEAKDGGP